MKRGGGKGYHPIARIAGDPRPGIASRQTRPAPMGPVAPRQPMLLSTIVYTLMCSIMSITVKHGASLYPTSALHYKPILYLTNSPSVS
jgi:hypothetical protein